MKVGIFGGTFDPVHVGHLLLAEEARVVLALNEVLFIPTGQPWLKAGTKVGEGRHRMAMVELAVAANPGFRASDMEIRRPGPTYTVDTLTVLRDELGPSVELYVILGIDAVNDLGRWHLPERIFELGTVVAAPRPGSQSLDARALDSVSSGASQKIMLLDTPLVGVSGRGIRRRVCNGQSIRYMVPDSVAAYIHAQGLYRC